MMATPVPASEMTNRGTGTSSLSLDDDREHS
jgi:hypothetical protein